MCLCTQKYYQTMHPEEERGRRARAKRKYPWAVYVRSQPPWGLRTGSVLGMQSWVLLPQPQWTRNLHSNKIPGDSDAHQGFEELYNFDDWVFLNCLSFIAVKTDKSGDPCLRKNVKLYHTLFKATSKYFNVFIQISCFVFWRSQEYPRAHQDF